MSQNYSFIQSTLVHFFRIRLESYQLEEVASKIADLNVNLESPENEFSSFCGHVKSKFSPIDWFNFQKCWSLFDDWVRFERLLTSTDVAISINSGKDEKECHFSDRESGKSSGASYSECNEDSDSSYLENEESDEVTEYPHFPTLNSHTFVKSLKLKLPKTSTTREKAATLNYTRGMLETSPGPVAAPRSTSYLGKQSNSKSTEAEPNLKPNLVMEKSAASLNRGDSAYVSYCCADRSGMSEGAPSYVHGNEANLTAQLTSSNYQNQECSRSSNFSTSAQNQAILTKKNGLERPPKTAAKPKGTSSKLSNVVKRKLSKSIDNSLD